MTSDKPIAALFDFDGVMVNTEWQYSMFWNQIGKEYFPEIEAFGQLIKGQTLVQIYNKEFAGFVDEQPKITARLDEFESKMSFDYITGVVDFIMELREHGVKIAIVTSSDQKKMSNAYRAHPELKQLADKILIAEMFKRSKPEPDCFLLGAEVFDTVAENCVVFEDSLHGLQAGNAAGMKVVGLATTFPEDRIKDMCDLVIPDFTAFNYEKMMSLLS